MKIMVVLNAHSNRGIQNHLERVLRERLGNHLFDIVPTQYPRHAREIARTAASAGVDTVVAVGGDGTVNEVVNGTVGSDAAVGIIPAGAANDLAAMYQLPSDLHAACTILLDRKLVQVDAIRVNGWHYVTSGGVGVPCEVARMANILKGGKLTGAIFGRLLRSGVYPFALGYAFVTGRQKRTHLTIGRNGEAFRVDAFALMVDNQPTVGKHFLVSPGAIDDDGEFDVCLIENDTNRLKTLAVLIKTLRGNHVHSPAVRIWRSGSLHVRSEEPISFFGDGELFGWGKEFEITIVPKAVKLVVPGAYALKSACPAVNSGQEQVLEAA